MGPYFQQEPQIKNTTPLPEVRLDNLDKIMMTLKEAQTSLNGLKNIICEQVKAANFRYV